MVGLHQILAGNIIICLEPLRLGLTVTEINIKKGQITPQEHTWVTVRTRVTPSFRVRVWFRATLLCLIFKRVLVAY